MFNSLPSKLKRTARWLPLALLGFGATAVQAQAPYFKFKPSSFAVSAGSYTPVSGGATILALADEDEDLSSIQNIGFTFPYNGKTFTRFQLSTNGFLKLALSATDTLPSTYSASSDAAGGFGAAYGQRIYEPFTAMWDIDSRSHNIVSPFNMDLMPATGALDHFSYEVTGSAPNRVLTVQWKEMRDFNVTAANVQYGQVNFQAKLYETTGVIEFVYGTFTSAGTFATNPASSRTAAVGVRGDSPNGGDEEDHVLFILKGSGVSWGATPVNPPGTTGALTTNPMGARVGPGLVAIAGGFVVGYGFNNRNAHLTADNSNPANLPTPGVTYTLTPDNSPAFTYTKLTSSVTVPGAASYTDLGAAGTAVLSGSMATDANSAATPIGFSFVYNGTTFTDLIANNNGYMKLGNTAPPVNLVGNGFGTGISTTPLATANNVLYPLNFDLTTGAGGSGEVRVATTGTVGSRVCTIQWEGVRDVSSTTNGGSGAAIQLFNELQFQVKLYEGSNTIEFVYGTFTPNPAAGATQTYKQFQAGIRGASDLPIQQITLFREGGSVGGWNTIGFHNTSVSNYGFIRNFIVNRQVLPTPGTTVTFEPSLANDLKVVSIFTLGAVAQPAGNPVPVRALIQNTGQNDYAGGGTVTLNVTGANTDNSTATIPAIPVGGSATVVFTSINNNNNGTNTLAVVLPADDNVGNNTKSMTQTVTTNIYSYKYPGQPLTGGVGFNGGTGNFVAGFNVATVNNINAVQVDFGSNSSAGTTYRIGIWSDNAGVPGTLLYQSEVLTVVGPNTTELYSICPAIAVNGKFYVGLRQLSTTNMGFGYQTEDPVRAGEFFFNSPVAEGGASVGLASTDWVDFADINAAFRPAIELQLELAAVLPNCPVIVAPANAGTYANSNTSVRWASGGNTVSYDVYFGTSNNPPLALSNTCGTSYQPGFLAPNTTYFWRVVGRNPAGVSTGCQTWSFTVAPNPTNDGCNTATNLLVCAAAPTFGWTNNATQSLPALTCAESDTADDDVWYTFVANSSAHRITVVPVGQFDAVIDLRSGGSCATSANIDCEDLRDAGEAEELLADGLTPGQRYYVRIYSRLGNSTQGQFNISINSDGGWTGNVSTDWFSAANWCDNNVPSATTSAVIRASVNQPVLNSSATVNNLTVDEGAVITLANSAVTLDVQRNNLSGGGALDGSGRITGPGTLRFTNNGSPTAQLVTGSVTVANVSFGNTSGGTTIGTGANGLIIGGTATVQPSAVVTLGGIFRFLSTAAGTARFAEVPTSASFNVSSGTFTVDRYIPSGSGRWAFVGAPVQNATLAQWSEVQPVINPLNNASVFYYQEQDASPTYDPISADTVERYGWRIPTGTGNVLNPGGDIRGYRVYARSSFNGGENFLSVNGAPYVGNVNVPVTFTPGQYDGGGWNLIANPYASTIDWNNVSVPASVNDAVFIFNGSQYQTYVKGTGTAQGVTVNGATRFIPSSQAFFVKTASTTSIQFQENDKTATAASFMREGDPVNQLRLTLKNSQGESDQTVIRFFDGATPGFDLRGDAGKPWGWVANLYTIDAQGKNYTVNSLPEVFSGRTIVPVGVEVYANGTYTISLTELESFPSNVSIRLRDKLNNTLVNPRLQPSYTFSVNGNPASQGRNRFEVIFDGAITSNKVSLNAARGLHIWPNPSASSEKANFAVQGFAAGKARAEVIDAMGRMVQTQVLELSGNGETIYTIGSGLPAGRYTLRVISGMNAAVSAFTVE